MADDVADKEREMREHEREARERDGAEQSPSESGPGDDDDRSAPPGAVPTTGAP
ncbi:MAG TPA: hypothetical protein VF533_23680 [Solirubrobacteraceae bacterium]|jgi:hypothetical protein